MSVIICLAVQLNSLFSEKHQCFCFTLIRSSFCYSNGGNFPVRRMLLFFQKILFFLISLSLLFELSRIKNKFKNGTDQKSSDPQGKFHSFVFEFTAWIKPQPL